MNTIYRIIWNVATGKWVVASELAKSRRKAKGRVAGRLASCAAVLGLGMAAAPSAFADNNVVALFNDAKDGTCTSLTDQATAPGMYSNGACTQSLGTGTATATSQDPFLNLISNQNGLFVGGGLEIYGNGVGSGPAAYIHGGLSLFSGAGMTGSANKIFGVASGDLGATSTDAVNGSQLHATNQQVSAHATSITNLDGRVTTVAQQATVNSGNITSLGSRVTTVEGDVTSLTNQMNTGSVGLVQQAAPGASLTVGKDIDGASVDFADKDGSYRTLSHIKGGTDDYDAVALWQLKSTTNAMAANVATALGGGATVTGDLPLFSAPTYNVQGGTQHDVGTALDALDGGLTAAQGDVTSLQGTVGSLQGAMADALAYDDTTHASVTLGGASASAPVALRNVASGELSATSTEAVNGSQLYATNQQVSTNTTSITNLDGRVTTVEGDVTNLDGRVTTVEGSVTSLTNQMNTGTVGLVQQAAAGAGLTVGKDTDGTSVDFADKDGNARTLTSIGAGTADTDAANVGQLKGTANSVAVALGGGASMNADGTLGAPTYTVQGDTQHDVGTALDALDGGLTAAQGDVTSLQGTVGSLQGAMADALAYDDTTHASVTLGGASASAPVALRNVASGELSATSTEAVNGSQLYATNQQVSTNTTSITNLDGRVTTVEGDVTNLDGRVTTVEGDVTNLDGRVTTVEGSVTSLTNQMNTGTVGLVQQAAAGAGLTVGKDTDGTSVDFADKDGNARTLTSIGAGTADTDAANVGQLKGTANSVAVALGGGASMNADGTLGAPTYTVQGDTQHDVGTALDALDGGLTAAQGDVTSLQGTVGSLQGAMADALAYDDTTHASVTLGGASASAPVALRNVASGELSATSTEAVNGSQLYATNQQVSTNTTSITNLDGRVTTVEGDVTNLDGRVTTVEGSVTSLTNQMNTGTVGLVQQAAAGAGLTVGKDTDGTSVDFADKDGNARTLTSIGAGTADTDAANVGQLKGTANSVAVALGGGASMNADGTLGAPTYTVQGDTQHDVGTALDALDGGLTAAQGDVTSLQGTVGSLQGAMADALAYDDTTHASVTLGGASASAPVALRNVASGELSATSTEAVNGSQLYATNQQVSANATSITNLDGRVTTVEGDVTNLDGRVTTVEGSVTSLTNQMNTGTVGLVQQAAAGAGLTVGKDTDGTSVDFADKDGNARTLTSIGAGTADTDAVNVSQLKSSLASAGLVDDDGNAVAAVTYDKNADGTPNHGSVTMGGGKASGPVTIKNVAAGVDDTDAVNVSQLKATGLVDGSGNAMDAVVYDAGSNRGMITLGGAGALAPVTLTNVANGKSMYDAVNFGQLSSLQSDLLSQISTVSDQVVNVGNQVADIDSRVTSIESGDTGLGGSLSYLDSNAASDAPHGNADAGDSAGLALGYDSVATGENASAIGQGAQALGSNGLAVGSGAYAAGPNDTAIGGNAKVNADHSTALGANSSVAANATNAVAVGAESQVNASSGTAIGQGASVAASATNAVAIGAGSQATQANSVSVGSAGNERVITNVAAGVNATDAVNVSQLQSTQDWARNYMDHATGALNNRINNVGRDAAAGTAAAIATANIPQAYAPNQGSVGAGVGTFNGQTAVAVGMSTVTPSGRWVLKANLTGNNRGDVGAGFGAAMVW